MVTHLYTMHITTKLIITLFRLARSDASLYLVVGENLTTQPHPKRECQILNFTPMTGMDLSLKVSSTLPVDQQHRSHHHPVAAEWWQRVRKGVQKEIAWHVENSQHQQWAKQKPLRRIWQIKYARFRTTSG